MVQNIYLDILNHVSFNWDKIIHRIDMYTTEKMWLQVFAENMTWSKIEQFPSCQILNISKYFNFQEHTPLQIFIRLSKLNNTGVSISFKETNKALLRYLKSNLLAYDGPAFVYEDLSIPKVLGQCPQLH